MLQKKERLTKTLFDRSFSVGKRIHMPSMQVIVAPSGTFHGAVVVGKKVYKKAVDRNRLRRQLYAILYRFFKDSPSTRTFIVVAKPYITKVSRDEFVLELKSALKKAADL